MKKNYVLGIVLGILSIICSLLFCGIKGLILGWIIGFTIGVFGIYINSRNKNKYKVKIANILCIIGVVLSILNLIFGIISKYL